MSELTDDDSTNILNKLCSMPVRFGDFGQVTDDVGMPLEWVGAVLTNLITGSTYNIYQSVELKEVVNGVYMVGYLFGW